MTHVPFFRWILTLGIVLITGSATVYMAAPEAPLSLDSELLRLSDILMTAGLLVTSTGLVGGNIRAMSRLRGVERGLLRRAGQLSRSAGLVAEDYAKAVTAIRAAWAPLHQQQVDAALSRIPASRLRHDDRRRFTTKEWERAGIHTVRDVLDSGVWTLGQLPGVGRRTAERALAAARRTAEAADMDVLVRVSPDKPTPGTTALVTALHVLLEAGPAARESAERARELSTRLELLLPETSAASGHVRMLRAGPEQRRRAGAAVDELRRLLYAAERDTVSHRFGQTSVDLLRGPDSGRDGLSAWADFESRPGDYYRLLAEVTGGGGAPRPDRRRSP